MAKDDEPNTSGSDRSDGLDPIMSGLEEVERKRRRRNLLGGLGVLALIVVAVGLVIHFQERVFRPEIDVSGGEREVLADTNDPQCRSMIADVTKIGRGFYANEPELADGLLADDPDRIEGLLHDASRMKQQLAEAEEASREANLRFDNSRGELDEWFDHVENELELLHRAGEERLEQVRPSDAGGDAGAIPDAGTIVEEPEKPQKQSDKTLRERVDGALLAINEAFQSFRVWHTGGLHPCGKAADGETPWKPPQTESDDESKQNENEQEK